MIGSVTDLGDSIWSIAAVVIGKLCTWGTSTEIAAATTLFQVEVYAATYSNQPSILTWLAYTPKPVSLFKHKPVTYLHRACSMDYIIHSCIIYSFRHYKTNQKLQVKTTKRNSI